MQRLRLPTTLHTIPLKTQCNNHPTSLQLNDSQDYVLQPEEDPFLLLEPTLRSVEEILQRRRELPLSRTWIEQPYRNEKINLLEEEVQRPAITPCLARVDELDDRLLAQQEVNYSGQRTGTTRADLECV